MELTALTKARAAELGWTPDFVARIEASPVMSERQADNIVRMHITEERASKYLDVIEANPDAPYTKFTFKFANPPTEMGIYGKPGPHGLGSHEVNIGTYGHVPDQWPYENDTPLGSKPQPGAYIPGPYHIYSKAEVWADGVDQMYDQAIRERWAAATDIKWAELQEQPDDMERAVCQICTVFSQHGLAESKIIASWMEKIAYGFHDMKNFMATHVYDSDRKVEVLRKRALSNGGGLGQMGLGTLYRAWFGAAKPTDYLVAIDVVYKQYEVALFELLAEQLPLAVDRDIFARLANDSRRHAEFGLKHLQYYIQYYPNGKEFAGHFLNKAESALSDELNHSHVETGAITVALAGGVENLQKGQAAVRELRASQLRRYLDALASIGIDRAAMVNPGLVAITQEPVTA
ncbi:MAG TPA: hypothetical protein VJQ83_05610 [Tepidiformaceae bacterium]|nr:hypothetical protein [Tepidiformaceae bacterium]